MKRYLFDIETAPMVMSGFVRWNANIAYENILHDWSILCWSAIDYDTGEIIQDSTHLHPQYFNEDPRNDYGVCYTLWQLFNNADVLIAHNGDKFDIKKTRARLAAHGFRPPRRAQQVDTLRIARSQFAFTSNRLGDLADTLGCKISKGEPSKGLWQRCTQGDVASCKEMLAYNLQDVYVLQDVFRKLMPWAPSTRVHRIYCNPADLQCPACGSHNLIKQGYHTNGRGRVSCKDCGRWSLTTSTRNKESALV